MTPTSPQVILGGDPFTIHEFNGRKASWAFRILKEIYAGVPGILKEMAKFTREYEAENIMLMPRASARHQFPEETAHLTDEDWAQTDQQLPLPRSPSVNEQVMAVFPMALDLAEKEVIQLLALLVTSPQRLTEWRQDGKDIRKELAEQGEILLDKAGIDELMELAAVSGEVIGDQMDNKMKELGPRLGNALRVFGINPKTLDKMLKQTPTEPTTETPSESKTDGTPGSPTGSPAPTPGPSEPLSTTPDGPSSSSAPDSSTPSEKPSSDETEATPQAEPEAVVAQ